MTNSADPDQLASEEANWSGSTLFAKTGNVVFSKRRINTRFLVHHVYKNAFDHCVHHGNGNERQMEGFTILNEKITNLFPPQYISANGDWKFIYAHNN